MDKTESIVEGLGLQTTGYWCGAPDSAMLALRAGAQCTFAVQTKELANWKMRAGTVGIQANLRIYLSPSSCGEMTRHAEGIGKKWSLTAEAKEAWVDKMTICHIFSRNTKTPSLATASGLPCHFLECHVILQLEEGTSVWSTLQWSLCSHQPA